MSDVSFSGSIARPWWRILSRRGVLQGDFAPIEASWTDIPLIDLSTYLNICGFNQPSDTSWPITYPQVLLTPLHMQLIAHPRFPFPGLGLVHVRQICEQHQPIVHPKDCRAIARADNLRLRKRGAELDLITELYSDDVLLWSAVTTVYSRKANGHGGSDSRTEPPKKTEHVKEDSWSLPENLGRQYTKISGDFNPIHLYAWTAKPFGFSKAIIHGMWTMAHALSKLRPNPTRVEVHFIRPVELPSSPLFSWEETDQGSRFWVSNAQTQKICLWGLLSHSPLRDHS